MHLVIYSLTLASLSALVDGHGAIISATGDMGGSGMAIGIDTSTPRDGTDDVPFQQDTTVFEGDAEFSCGETDQTSENDEVNDIESGVEQVMANSNSSQLPQVSQGGELRMMLHEVNSDGGGPYVCMIDATGTGQNWVAMEVTEQVPGEDGENDEGEATDFPLTAKVAQDQVCTGNVAGQDKVCMVRCQNPEGPFGGCVPVQLAGDIQEVADPVMSETGGTAEDDVNAIVDSAEEGTNGNGDGAVGNEEEANDAEEEAGDNENGANDDGDRAGDGEERTNDDEEGTDGNEEGGDGNGEEDIEGNGGAEDVGESSSDGTESTDGSATSLFDRVRKAKARKLKRATRVALSRHQRRVQRALRKAALSHR